MRILSFLDAPSSLLHLVFLLGLSKTLVGVHALTNVTVDDQDPQIVYAPSSSWMRVDGPDLDAGGGHMLTEDDPGATATITYTFVSVYFMSTLWPYPVRDNIAIDGGQPMLVDLEDYSRPDLVNGSGTVASSVVAWYEGTESAEHTIVVSVPPGIKYSVVDMFIFTVLDASDSTDTVPSGGALGTTGPSSSTEPPTTGGTSTSVSSSSFTITTLSASPTPSSFNQTAGPNAAILTATKKPTLRIALGVVGAILGLLLIAALLWCCCKRRHRNRGDDGTSAVLLPRTIEDPQDGMDDDGERPDGPEDGGGGYQRVSTTDGLASITHTGSTSAQGGLGRTPNWDGSSRRGSSTYASSSRPYSQTLLGRQPTAASSIYSVPTRQRGDGLASTTQIVLSSNPPSAYLDSSGGAGSGYLNPGTDSGGTSSAAAAAAPSASASASAPPSAYKTPSKKAEASTANRFIFGGDGAED